MYSFESRNLLIKWDNPSQMKPTTKVTLRDYDCDATRRYLYVWKTDRWYEVIDILEGPADPYSWDPAPLNGPKPRGGITLEKLLSLEFPEPPVERKSCTPLTSRKLINALDDLLGCNPEYSYSRPNSRIISALKKLPVESDGPRPKMIVDSFGTVTAAEQH